MKKKILIIEDDTALSSVYFDMFQGSNYLLINATSGIEGLTLIESKKPDLIILDIMLPGGMNGFDVLEKIEANPNTKGIPVIILTNLDSEEKVAKIIGAQKYLVKANTSKSQIVKAVKECLS